MERNILRGIFVTASLSLSITTSCLLGYVNAAENDAILKDTRPLLILESVKQSFLASQRLEALTTKSTDPETIQSTPSPDMWLKRVKAHEVNMVTNRNAADVVSKISMGGKIYYTSTEAYTRTLKQNPSLRFAKDPLTNTTVDKADAVIYADASGRAFYFESEETYENFISLAGKGLYTDIQSPSQPVY